MSRQFSVAVVGATGLIGERVIELLIEREFPYHTLHALASESSAGESKRIANQSVKILDVAEFDFSNAEIVILCAGQDASSTLAHRAAESGCIVIDHSSFFRYEDDVPLVIPEVNADDLADYKNCNIIANPNCSTIQMLMALKPIYDLYGLDRVDISTYQAVSGAGKKGIDALAHETAMLLNAKPIEKKGLGEQIAFNLIPQIDTFQANGFTREEMKMVWETQKILGDSTVQVNPTCVRVPVFFGHAVSAHVQTSEPLDIDMIKKALKDAPGVTLLEEGELATPVTHGVDEHAVTVSRVRADLNTQCGVNLWIVADNTLKGGALNSVQIAEKLIEDYL